MLEERPLHWVRGKNQYKEKLLEHLKSIQSPFDQYRWTTKMENLFKS